LPWAKGLGGGVKGELVDWIATLDAPGASAIVASKEYQVFIASLKEKYPNAFNNTEDTPNVGENFINIVC
jgi:hypothetical protein